MQRIPSQVLPQGSNYQKAMVSHTIYNLKPIKKQCLTRLRDLELFLFCKTLYVQKNGN